MTLTRQPGTCDEDERARKLSAETAPFPGRDFHSAQKPIMGSHMFWEKKDPEGGACSGGLAKSC